jgi:hypothetical protein
METWKLLVFEILSMTGPAIEVVRLDYRLKAELVALTGTANGFLARPGLLVGQWDLCSFLGFDWRSSY